jgi:hypothetical protein
MFWSLAQDIAAQYVGGNLHWNSSNRSSGSYIHIAQIREWGASFVNTICAVDDEVWIGTGDGVSRFLDGNWSVLSSAETG